MSSCIMVGGRDLSVTLGNVPEEEHGESKDEAYAHPVCTALGQKPRIYKLEYRVKAMLLLFPAQQILFRFPFMKYYQ